MQNKILNYVFWSPLFACELGFYVLFSEQSVPANLSAGVPENSTENKKKSFNQKYFE